MMFKYVEMSFDGTPMGNASLHPLNELRAKISLLCPLMSLKQREHFIDLAVAAAGGPVDVTHWSGDNEATRRMTYSARIWSCPIKQSRPPLPADRA